MPRDPQDLARELLGRPAGEIEPLVVWPDRASFRVTCGAERFVIKTDDDANTVAREAAGQARAAAAGVRVPELIGVSPNAFAMRWVEGVTLRDHSTADAWADTGRQLRIAHDVGGAGPFGTGFGGFEPEQPTWRSFFDAFAERTLRDGERDLGFPARQAARVRAALRAAAPRLDAPHLAWCHGDFQTQHGLIDPSTDRVAAIIDWADHGSGDVGWDVAVLTLDDRAHLGPFLDGYGATVELRAALGELLPLYSVVRLLGSASWLAEHGHPLVEDHLNRAIAWRPRSG